MAHPPIRYCFAISAAHYHIVTRERCCASQQKWIVDVAFIELRSIRLWTRGHALERPKPTRYSPRKISGGGNDMVVRPLAALATWLALAGSVAAQDYPNRTIKMLVPY